MNALTFSARRQVGLSITIFALAIVGMITWLQETRLAHTSFFTGITLLATILFLTLLGVRRRLPVLSLGNVSSWTQIHLYAGLFSVGVYLLHVPALIGNGLFESTLSVVFLLVAASGFYGIYASRTIPKQISAVAGEVRFDQLGWHRGQIARKADQLLASMTDQTSAGVIGRLYDNELEPYFFVRSRVELFDRTHRASSSSPVRTA